LARIRERFDCILELDRRFNSCIAAIVSAKCEGDEGAIYGCLSLDEGSFPGPEECVPACQVIVVRWRRNPGATDEVSPGNDGDKRQDAGEELLESHRASDPGADEDRTE